MGKIGPKEQALKELKSQRAESDIPKFLRRTETPEQAAKREAKHAKKTDPKLKVIEPYNPNDPIKKAIERDLKDSLDPNKTAGGDAAIPTAVKQFVIRGRKAQAAVDAITKNIPVSELHKHPAAKANAESWDKIPAVKKAKPAKEKKLPHALQKALAEKAKLETLVHSAQAKPMETDVKKKTAKSKTTKTKAKAKAASKKTTRKNGSYDWDIATATAKSGKVPSLPTFRSYAPHIAKFRELAMKKDVAGIKKFSAEFCDEKGARTNMFRYRDLCLMALKA